MGVGLLEWGGWRDCRWWVDADGPSRAGLGRRSEGVYIGEVDWRMERILLLDYKLTILTWLQCF